MWLAIPLYVACLLIFIQILACHLAHCPKFCIVKYFLVSGLKIERGFLSPVGNVRDMSTEI